MAYKPNDHYARRARAENYAARSVYKLEELDRRYRLLRPGQRVLDLGASPGSWSQYASQKTGAKGVVVGVDLKSIAVALPNAVFLQTDLEKEGWWKEFEHPFREKFDVVLSDMAPSTTGNKLADQAQSYALCTMALQAAKDHLRPGGHFVCKMFESDETPGFRDELKSLFSETHLNRPAGTQKGSRELFLVGLKFRGGS
jgi:23S rRNA (uridine2552-2'-O)-methyltransferase